MKQIEITYTREITFNKIINVSDKLAERLLQLDGEDLMQTNGKWGAEEDDTEEVENNVFKADDVSSDDFTLIAEDLTSIHDVYDAMNEITNVSITEYKSEDNN